MENREHYSVTYFDSREFGLRENEDEKSPGTITGIACPFNTLSDDGAIYGFREQFAPGSFQGSIGSDKHDIKGFWMHKKEIILGSKRAGTLRLEEKPQGLYFEIDLPPNENGRNAAVSVGRGDVSQVSFAFRATSADWDESDPENIIRTVREAEIYEVSPEAFAAYGDNTNVGKRSIKADYDDYKEIRNKDKLNDEIIANKALLDLRKKQTTLHERA